MVQKILVGDGMITHLPMQLRELNQLLPGRTPARLLLGYSLSFDARKITIFESIWDISRLVPRLRNHKSWDIIKAIGEFTRLFSGALLDILLYICISHTFQKKYKLANCMHTHSQSRP